MTTTIQETTVIPMDSGDVLVRLVLADNRDPVLATVHLAMTCAVQPPAIPLLAQVQRKVLEIARAEIGQHLQDLATAIQSTGRTI